LEGIATELSRPRLPSLLNTDRSGLRSGLGSKAAIHWPALNDRDPSIRQSHLAGDAIICRSSAMAGGDYALGAIAEHSWFLPFCPLMSNN
jgi:hypothetical protein